LIEKYCIHSTGWNPGEHAYILNRYRERETSWKEEVRKWYDPDTPADLARGEEYAAYIMNAISGGEPYCFNGNVPNANIITNLPAGACVEVPVWASRKGFEPVTVGALPPQLAVLTALSAQTEEMAVEGCLTGDPMLIYQAIVFDPLTSAVLSLGEIREMVNLMFEQNRDYLGYFERLKV
jgi:alpha-galactosidase